MTAYTDMGTDELSALRTQLETQLEDVRAKGLQLNMARGKPGADQLELSMPMLDMVTSASDLHAADGTDCRNYGVLLGLPEARELMASLVGARPEQTVVCGSSSLALMFAAVSRAWTHGLAGNAPWGTLPCVKFLCPAPGYDRHFTICEYFGIEMIPIEMGPDGPDMARVKQLVEGDAAVKGIWCVPKYANPLGTSYSDETVRAFAALEPAAPDFRIFWDNAYVVHHLSSDPAEQDSVLNLLELLEQAGKPDMAFQFCSTSKVTFPGAGIAAVSASEANVARIAAALTPETIGFDKINQLRHVRFLKDAEGVAAHMAKHAELIAPKFDAVLNALETELADIGGCSWSTPRGGYFVSFFGPHGTAKRVVELAASAGVTMTGAGATWPLHDDPHDSDIRIAPTYPSLEELQLAMQVFCTCVKLASVERLLAQA